MAKRVNFWELPVEAAQPDDTLVAYRGRGKVARIKVDDVQGSGTVTSVGLSMPAGFQVANAPVTSSGTITVTFAGGYGLPTTTQMGQWSTAFGWGDHAQAGYALASAVTSALAGKVDKVAGKGLSTEDYSTAEKSKLAGVEAGAQVNTVTSVAGKTGAVTLTKGDVGLGNVDNTSDADKPISTAVSTALSGKVDTSDARLTNSREWTASTVSQAEAEAGTATTRRAWTAQRVWQAITAWWNASAAKSKLDGIQAGATANQTDAYLLNRANHTGTQAASTITGLATVATTGSYNDLTGKPTIPAAQVPADWNATSGVARILNKPTLGTAAAANTGDFATAAQGNKADTAYSWGNHATAGYALSSNLATVATTGSYNDLINKPTIPTLPATVSQAEAEAGTATTTRLWTAQRVKQAVVAAYNALTSVFGRTLASASDAAAARTALGLSTVAQSGSYNDLSNKPSLGTAASANVTTSNVDTVPGRVLKVGDFGVGGGVFTRDPDTNTAAGIYSIGSAQKEVPGGTIPGWATYINLSRSAHGEQLFVRNNTLQFRSRSSGTVDDPWGTLYSVWHNGNFDPSTKANTSHTHSASDITSGTLADARLPARLGPTAQSISDWNSATSNGWYMSSTAANAPAGGWFIGHTENHGAAGWCTQTVHAFSGDTEGDTKTYRREQNNGSWGPWYRLRVSEAEQLTQTAAYAYSKSQVDNLISAATSGAWVWQSTTTALAKNTPNKVDFSSPRTLTLPASPAENDYVAILRTAGTTVGSTIARNGKTIMGVAEDMTLDVNVSYLRLDYVNSSWRIAS